MPWKMTDLRTATPVEELALLKSCVIYNCETGKLHWHPSGPHRNRKKKEVGSFCFYVVCEVFSKSYPGHVLAWMLHHGDWPAGMIDHIDGNPLNNKISNLRLVTASQNSINQKIRADNKSGYKGVRWVANRNKWSAEIRLNGKSTWLGHHDTMEDAAKAYAIASANLHGEFARTSTLITQ